MAIESIDDFFDRVEDTQWNTQSIFKPVDDWTEEDGDALFFKLDAGEPPLITSPISSDFVEDYFTHWMAMPKEFGTGYRMACIKSGIERGDRSD